MNVSHPDEFDDTQNQDEPQAPEELKASDKQSEKAPPKAAPPMERSSSNPIIINK